MTKSQNKLIQQTIIVLSENKPGVLYRIADLFLRRRINVETLSVSETERRGVSKFRIEIFCRKEVVVNLVKQIERIVEVIKVKTGRQYE